MSDDFLYVDPERVRGLITAIDAGADALGAIHVDQQAGALSTALPGTTVGTVCSAGALSAATAIEATGRGLRRLATATNAGLSAAVAADQDTASRLPQGH
ncbi:hypothetical protein [Nocardia aurantia]|uniref:ESX-1 secretion-associated protein n=1 Tax=Nocardia aurantia TaxID=2585199 RepID=A0A7K0E0G3_9NOCA|nr:hypothetical protein [Nocardia aurantia]MQY31549.1 hypothetical protein [Nocardia aurantia]